MESKEHTYAAEADDARKEEATSDETLAEIEETQQVGGTTGATDSSSSVDAAPAPDGTPDSERGSSADSSETGGPM